MALNSNGALVPLANISVYVYSPGTTSTVSIYQARTGGTQKSNPIVTGADGAVEFYADTGEYDIRTVDNQAPARITDKTVSWAAVGGADGGIPSSKISPAPLTSSDLTSINSSITTLNGRFPVTSANISDATITVADLAGSTQNNWLKLISPGDIAVARGTGTVTWAGNITQQTITHSLGRVPVYVEATALEGGAIFFGHIFTGHSGPTTTQTTLKWEARTSGANLSGSMNYGWIAVG